MTAKVAIRELASYTVTPAMLKTEASQDLTCYVSLWTTDFKQLCCIKRSHIFVKFYRDWTVKWKIGSLLLWRDLCNVVLYHITY